MTDDAASFWANARADDERRNAATVLDTDGTPPDQAAEHQRLAVRAGVPVGVVASDPASVRRQVARDDLGGLAQTSPELASWAGKPENYAVARDDLEPLGKVAGALQSLQDIQRAVVAAVPGTIGSTLSGAGDLFDAVGRRGARSLESLFGLEANMTPLAEQIGSPADVARFVGGKLKQAGAAVDVPEQRRTLGTDIAGAVGQLGTQVVQAIVAAPTLFPSLLSQGADQMAERVRDADAEGTMQGDVAILGGAAVTGLTERYGLDKLLHRLPPKIRNTVLRHVADAFAGGGVEAAQEVTEGVAQDVLTRALLDPDHRIGDGVLRQAEAAGGAGTVARLAVQLIGGRRAHLQAQAERDHLDTVMATRDASKTRARSPERFEAMAESVAPERMVYLPADALAAHFTASKTDPAAAIADLTGDPNAYAEALATGAEVAIPLPRYVARMGTDAHAALAGQIRLQPGEDMKPDAVMPDRAQIEADIAAGLAEARAATNPGETVASDTHERPLLTDPAQAEDWTGYQAAVAHAQQARRDAAMQERQRAQALATDAHARKQTQAAVEQELRGHPVYRAATLLRTGKHPNGAPAAKLDHAAVVAAIGEERAGALKGMTRKKGGAKPDEVAALLGYPSGAKLLHDLATAPKFADMVRVETDARMQARTTQDSDHDTATDAQADMMLREIQALEARNGGIRTHDATLREVARRLIAEKAIPAVQPNLYRQAEAKTGREAFHAASKQDWTAAAAARRRQLLNLYLYREARNTRAEATATGKYLAQFGKTKTRAAIGKAGGGFLEQIDALLQRFDFRHLTGPQDHRRQQLAEWIKAKAEQGIIVDVPASIADEAFRVPFRRLKVGELRDLRDAVEHLAHLANQANVLRVGNERFDRMMVDEAMALSVLDGNRKRPRNTGDRRLGDAAREQLLKARTVMGAATDIARELDGFADGGAVWTHTVGVIRKASDTTHAALDKAQEAVAAIKLKHYTRDELRALAKDKRFFPEVGDSWSKARVLALALNWGNAGNREAVLTQAVDRLTPEQVGVLLRSLDARDWRFVQAVWAQVDSYWPEIQATAKRRKGLAPEKVPPSPFTITTADGQTLTLPGGYYPLKYEADNVKAMRDEAGDYYDSIRTGRFTKAATKDGHTIERVGSGGRSVRLDLDVIDGHLRNVIRDLHLGDAINFVHQALHGEQFGKAARDTASVPLVKGLDTWLRDVASGEMGLHTVGEQVTRVLRTNFTAAVLTWKASSALLQVTGLVQSSVVLGTGPMLDGVQRFARRPAAMYRYAQAASPFMRRRLQTHVEAVRLVMGAEAGRLSSSRAEMIRRGYWMIGRVQSLVDVATWIAAEKQGMAKFSGNLDKARRFADDVVSRAQGSGEFIDKNAMQRGTLSDNVRQSEYIRATTALMGYLIAKQNAGYELVRKANVRNVRGASKLAANLVLLFAVEGMLARVIRGQWPDDDDDDGSMADDWLALAASEGASNLFGGVPGLSQAVTELRGYTDRSLVSEAWHAAGQAMTQAEQGEADEGAAKAAVNLAGLSVGVPSSQINRTLSAIVARDEQDVTPWEYVNGPDRE